MTPQQRIAELRDQGYWMGAHDPAPLQVGDTVTTKGWSPQVGRIVDLYGISAVVRIDGRTLTFSIDRIVRIEA